MAFMNDHSLLIFAGSTRTQSWNRRLALATAACAKEQGVQPTVLELGDFDLPLYNADLEARGTPAAVIRLKELFFRHPAWIICSPEYNGSYTGLLKNTIDWVSSPVKGDPIWSSGTKPFAGKVVGLMAASPGALGGLRGLSHLTPLLMNLQCWVAPRQFALARASEAFDETGALKASSARDTVSGVVRQVIWASQALQQADSA